MDKRLKSIIVALAVLLFGFLAYYFSNIVAYILIAAVLSLIGQPIVRLLLRVKYRKFRFGRAGAALLTLILLWFSLISFFGFLIPLIVSEINQLSNINVQEVLQYLETAGNQLQIQFPRLMPQFFGGENLQDFFETQLSNLLNIGKVSNLFSTLATLVGDIFMMFFSVSFILFFFLKEEGLFGDWILVLSPVKYEDKVSNAMESISVLLKRYLIGMVLEVIGVMVLAIIGLTIAGIGFGHAVIVGVFIGLLNVIPYIGPWIGGLFGIVVVVANHLTDSFTYVTLPLMVLVLVVVIVVQLIDNMVFQPVIYSNSVKAHPLEIFLVILMAGSLAGIPGMILGVPVYTVLRTIAGEFLSEFKIVKRLTSHSVLDDKKS